MWSVLYLLAAATALRPESSPALLSQSSMRAVAATRVKFIMKIPLKQLVDGDRKVLGAVEKNVFTKFVQVATETKDGKTSVCRASRFKRMDIRGDWLALLQDATTTKLDFWILERATPAEPTAQEIFDRIDAALKDSKSLLHTDQYTKKYFEGASIVIASPTKDEIAALTASNASPAPSKDLTGLPTCKGHTQWLEDCKDRSSSACKNSKYSERVKQVCKDSDPVDGCSWRIEWVLDTCCKNSSSDTCASKLAYMIQLPNCQEYASTDKTEFNSRIEKTCAEYDAERSSSCKKQFVKTFQSCLKTHTCPVAAKANTEFYECVYNEHEKNSSVALAAVVSLFLAFF